MEGERETGMSDELIIDNTPGSWMLSPDYSRAKINFDQDPIKDLIRTATEKQTRGIELMVIEFMAVNKITFGEFCQRYRVVTQDELTPMKIQFSSWIEDISS